MSVKNGAVARALALRPPFGPTEVATLLAARAEVLLRLATTEAERGAVTGRLAAGWEETPDLSRLVELLARRAMTGEDRQILRLTNGFRRLLPEPQPQAPPDPEIEKAIDEACAAGELAAIAARIEGDQRLVAEAALSKSRNPSQAQARAARLREAEQSHLEAVQRWERALVTIHKLEQRREARRQAAAAGSAGQ